MITTEFPSFPALFWSTNGLMDDQPHDPSLHSLSQSLHKYSAFVPALLFGSDEQKRTCYPLSLTRICLLSCDLHWNCPRTAISSFATPGRELCNKWKTSKRKTYYRIEPTVSKHDKAHASQLKKLLFEEWQQAHGNIFVTQATMKKLPYQTTKLQNQ